LAWPTCARTHGPCAHRGDAVGAVAIDRGAEVPATDDLGTGAAFGGYKMSGIGRENHAMMLDIYSQTKAVLVSTDENKLGFF
jgi:acyl-CoA reductase-like NAD-dependent aldehyde dehydrogenase